MHNITIIGIGNIGAAMVRAWLRAGFAVTMWNRNPDRPALAQLASEGAAHERDLARAVAGSDLTVLCVSTYDNIRALFSPLLPLAAPPKRIINLTTGTSQQARDMAAWFKDGSSAAYYFDGAIMVTPELVGTEYSTVYISGENETLYNEVIPALEPLGTPYYVAEDVGAASLWDIAALAAMSGMWTASFTAMSLLKRQRPDDVVADGPAPSVAKPMRQIVLPLLRVFLDHVGAIADALDGERWDDNFGNGAAMQLKGTETTLQCLREEGVSTEGLDLFHRLLKRTITERGGDAGLAVMATYLLGDGRE